jgi:hypothetical protein
MLAAIDRSERRAAAISAACSGNRRRHEPVGLIGPGFVRRCPCRASLDSALSDLVRVGHYAASSYPVGACDFGRKIHAVSRV